MQLQYPACMDVIRISGFVCAVDILSEEKTVWERSIQYVTGFQRFLPGATPRLCGSVIGLCYGQCVLGPLGRCGYSKSLTSR